MHFPRVGQHCSGLLFHYLIADFLSSPGCFSAWTAAPPALRSGRCHARPLMAAQGRVWTRSACPPVTPAARQTVRASLPLTALIPSRTRWDKSWPILIISDDILCFAKVWNFCFCVLFFFSYQNPLLIHPSTPWILAPPQPASPWLLSLPRSRGLHAHIGGLSLSHPWLPARPVKPQLTTRKRKTRAS